MRKSRSFQAATFRWIPKRIYASYQAMAEEESKLPVGERIDFVSIVTPNHVHFPVAKTFLESGFNVVCDKPMTFNLDEAIVLRDLVSKTSKVFALTHNYTGYPMVKEAREMVRRGDLGKILKVVAEYPQGWLLDTGRDRGQQRRPPGEQIRHWREPSSCIGDIGTHAENLGRYITGLEIEELCADFTTFVEGRRLEDDGNLLLHYQGGARGVLSASQICAGEENDVNIRVYGTKASLEWHQENPNELTVKYPDAPRRIFRRGNGYLSETAKKFTRLPFGHPEAFIEAFANIYLEAARAIEAEVSGQPLPQDLDFPTAEDGVKGMAFIAAAVQSAKNGGIWTKMPGI